MEQLPLDQTATTTTLIAGTLLAVLIIIVTFSANILSAREQARQSSQKISSAEQRLEEEPEKAKPAWDLARATLESYFNRNLSQINHIFWLSVVVMTIGFAIIIWGISRSLQSPDAIVPAAIAGIAGIITEFIGATFLFIYRSTIEQAVNYSKTLERINSVGMAMQILDTMPDATTSNDLKSTTKAKLVELLVQQAHDIPNTIQNEGEKKKSNPPKA